ncbi:MAG: hypothetical protein ACYDFT_01170 [Thermoplasmata archaeon]
MAPTGPTSTKKKGQHRRGDWFWGLGPRISPEERQRALDDPGPSWSEYFFRDFLRWWTVLGFFVVDAVIVSSFLRPLAPLPLLLGLAAAIYFEFLLYEYLWHIPSSERLPPRVRPSWRRAFHPVPAGRWTLAFRQIREGARPPAQGTGPDPADFQ